MDEGRGTDGYRRTVGRGGAVIRADVVDVYVFRRGEQGAEFLQVRRARAPLEGTWQPVMGHVEEGETSVMAVRRELREEVGLDVGGAACAGLWALEQVRPFYVHQIDAVVLAPRFACEVAAGWEASLNGEHSAARWVEEREVGGMFVWPGQREALREIGESFLTEGAPARALLAVARA
ncbi:MAG: NUDIX domain-containing protein [Phycisphaerales bacterium]